MTNLVEKAKEAGRLKKVKYDPEIIDLAFAYFNDEITGRQATIALGLVGNSSSLYHFMSHLKSAYASGDLTITYKGREKKYEDR